MGAILKWKSGMQSLKAGYVCREPALCEWFGFEPGKHGRGTMKQKKEEEVMREEALLADCNLAFNPSNN